jgi:hypothetical protein
MSFEFFEEDMSPSGLAKIREALAEVYPEDAEALMLAPMEWPRPLMVVEGAVFGGLEILMHHSGDVVTRGEREAGKVPTDG